MKGEDVEFNLSSGYNTFVNSYYLTLVLKADLEEKDRKVLVDDLVQKLTKNEGKLEKQDLWGLKDLSYPVKKQTKGFYVHLEFNSEPQIIRGLDKTLKVEENLLRYLLIRR